METGQVEERTRGACERVVEGVKRLGGEGWGDGGVDGGRGEVGGGGEREAATRGTEGEGDGVEAGGKMEE